MNPYVRTAIDTRSPRIIDPLRIEEAYIALLATGATIEGSVIDNVDDTSLPLALEYLAAVAGLPCNAVDDGYINRFLDELVARGQVQ